MDTTQVESDVARRLHDAGLRLTWFEPPPYEVDGEDDEDCPACGIPTTTPLGWEVVVENGRRVCDPCVKRHSPELFLARELANAVRLNLWTESKSASEFRGAVALALLDIVRAGDGIAKEYKDTPLPF